MAGLKDTTKKVKNTGGQKPSIVKSIFKTTAKVGMGVISRTSNIALNQFQQENPGLSNLTSPLTGIAQDLAGNNRNSFLYPRSSSRGGNGDTRGKGKTKLDRIDHNTEATYKETRKTRQVLEGVAGTTQKSFFEQVKANQLKQKEQQDRIRQKFKDQTSKDAKGNVINPFKDKDGKGGTTKDNPLWQSLLQMLGGFNLFAKAGGFLKLIGKITGLGMALGLLTSGIKKLSSWLLNLTGLAKLPQLIKNVVGGVTSGAKSLVSNAWDATKTGAKDLSDKVRNIFSKATPEEKALNKAQKNLEKTKQGTPEHQKALKEVDEAKSKAGKPRFEEVKKSGLKTAAESLVKEAPKTEAVAANVAKGVSKAGKVARVGAVAGAGIAGVATGAVELAAFMAVAQVAENAIGSMVKNVYMAATGEQTIKESLKGFVVDAKTLIKEDWNDMKKLWHKIVPQNKDLNQAVSLKSQQTVNDQLREQKNQPSGNSGGNVSVINAPTNAQRTSVNVSVSATDGGNRFNQQ